MDRLKYKEEAKELIKGKKWYLWKPLVMFSLTMFVAAFVLSFLVVIPLLICGVEEEALNTTVGVIGSSLGSIVGLVETVFMYGYAKYCLDFVRGKNPDWKEPLHFIKDHFVPVILVSLLVGLMVVGGTILLIIPGIIIAIGHVFIQEVYVDNSELKTMDVIRKSWSVTYGHKMDLFVLGLSFFGWILLVGLTAGILAIWVVPYMNITFLLVYEELTKGSKRKEKEEPVKEAIIEPKKGNKPKTKKK